MKTQFWVILISLLGGCHKPCSLPNYNFSVTDNFIPETDSIRIGDTLWLSSTTNKSLDDINSQTKVDFSTAENFGTTLLISDISKFQLERGAVDSFGYIKRHGNIYLYRFEVKPLWSKTTFF